MFDNPIKRESVKTVATIGAIVTGGPIVAAAVAVLGVGVEALGLLGEKRTRELFDTDELIVKVSRKMNTSDNFASVVFDVWQRHNFESNVRRRKLLKNFLRSETDNDSNEFENFSQILEIIQNISFYELDILEQFYEYCKKNDKVTQTSDAQKLNTGKTTQLDMQGVFHALHLPSTAPGYALAINAVNQLASKGLIKIEYRGNGRDGSPLYAMNRLGEIVLEYICEEDV